jgi:L-arabinose isomerase
MFTVYIRKIILPISALIICSCQNTIKEGPITMLSISSTYEGKFKLVIAEGESMHGSIPPTGNTNTRGLFKPDVKTFLKRWVAEIQ